MPTGTAMRDARGQLFDAAERVLLRSGPGALTSRAVTEEAGCAKGVLHRHFTDFDDFLYELITDRMARFHPRAAALLATAGTATVPENLAAFLSDLFNSVATAMVPLLTFRDGLRSRLRRDGHQGLPLLTEAGTAIEAYLTAERDLGRIPADTDPHLAALTLIGTGHLLWTTDPSPSAIDQTLAAAHLTT
jgi:AcrR family transcriptional regulator